MFQIKTLRLATSYISYLMVVLETNKPALDFRADLIAGELHPSKRSLNRNNCNSLSIGYNFRDGRAPLITHFENTHLVSLYHILIAFKFTNQFINTSRW